MIECKKCIIMENTQKETQNEQTHKINVKEMVARVRIVSHHFLSIM